MLKCSGWKGGVAVGMRQCRTEAARELDAHMTVLKNFPTHRPQLQYSMFNAKVQFPNRQSAFSLC